MEKEEQKYEKEKQMTANKKWSTSQYNNFWINSKAKMEDRPTDLIKL